MSGSDNSNMSGSDKTDMSGRDDTSNIEFEAAAFRQLVQHLRDHPEVQNIDLMNLAGFCRNCLANWYKDAAAEQGVSLSKDAAREIIYGMPYSEWQSRFQTEASPQAQAAFEKAAKHS